MWLQIVYRLRRCIDGNVMIVVMLCCGDDGVDGGGGEGAMVCCVDGCDGGRKDRKIPIESSVRRGCHGSSH